MSQAEEKLRQLGIELPDPPEPVASYVPAVKVEKQVKEGQGNLLFVSGQIPLVEGKLAYEGVIDKDLSVEKGREAARLCALNALAVIQKELGTLNRVTRIVRVSGYVASFPGFFMQATVINSASELLAEVFGERGKHSRIALGVTALPLNAPVEIALIVEYE